MLILLVHFVLVRLDEARDMPGFQTFYSPPLRRPGSHQYLPGSCLFIADVLKPEHPPVCDWIEQSLVSFNATCCFVTCSPQKLAIVCVYRSPSIPMSIGLDDLGQLLSKLMLVSRHMVLAGDLNIDMLSTCAATTNHQDLFDDFNLVQHVSGPSRVTESSSSLIDHIVTTLLCLC